MTDKTCTFYLEEIERNNCFIIVPIIFSETPMEGGGGGGGQSQHIISEGGGRGTDLLSTPFLVHLCL